MSKSLPKALTSYDLLKTLAIILTIVDHVGHFFYPEEMWFRTLGRLCIPIWFFLIGYANTTTVPKSFWIGGTVLVISAMVAGQYLLPLNILFTMAALRLYRAGVVRHSLPSFEALRGMFLILFFLGFPTAILCEYGALAMLMVLVGFIARRREDVYKNIDPKYVMGFVVATYVALYIMLGVQMPSLSTDQALFMMVGFIAIGVVLWRFRPVVYVDAHKYMAPSIIRILQFTGRRTLEIYVAHLLIFRAVAMYLMPDKFVFMDWHIAPPSLIAMFT
tara:strand:- start:44231 stop:45055 length:825 start_codon:yes stop_codon:yes gene_type:complete